ncbi:hypothetical protein FV226_27165 [Methylobacterium sp. WL12]|uniref:hypothetical protein n=1 Tax=Methylobacterium sp. WL12 TaxID=2603890 RepID=UPI0011CCBC59|nr:hypothetical protein [Methylobacterium sp. WL12]TXM63853.1 hypothetical protein FV226_27165 [Methylobacterium sp. WL12]
MVKHVVGTKKEAASPMSEADDYLRAFLDQAAAEEAYLGRLREANDAEPGVTLPRPASAPAVSLMITNQQRAELRALGFSDEAVRLMTPAEAHAQLGLSRPSL